jgi:NADPH:quinone reductase-like Zn-dependent oxidoreductase
MFARAPLVQAAASSTRVWEIGARGGFDTLRQVSRETPQPGPGQVLVDVHMSGIAARDQAIVQGWFLEDKSPTLIPLSEGVGTILAVGPGEQRLQVGQRVTCCHFASWVDGPWTPANYAVDVGNTVDGWLGQQVLLPASGVVVVPDSISDATAATLSGSAVTAWHALHVVARVQPEDTVLSLGTGGVSSWGLLLAKAAGARVAVTSSSDAKLGRMRELGADITVNYRTTPDWGEAIYEATGGGATIVLENVGRKTLDQSMLAAGNNAMLVMIGTAPLPEQLPKMPGFYVKNLAMKAISNGSRRMLEDLLTAVAAQRLEGVVSARFSFSAAVEAFEAAAAGANVGKVLIAHKG